MSDSGLKNKHKQQIIDILQAQQHVESAFLFGSRALGTYRDNSDIDLALIGEAITTSDIATILDKIEHTTIPYKVDVVVMHKVTNHALIDHIKQHGQKWL